LAGVINVQELKVTVQQKNGLHLRIAASLIVKLQELVDNQEILKNTVVKYQKRTVQITNLLAIVSLRIRQNDKFSIIFPRIIPDSIKNEIYQFFENVEVENQQESKADQLLMENSIIFEEAVANLPNGMVVVNTENRIIYVNEAAVKLLEVSLNEILNRKADEIIPHSKLKEVMDTGKVQFAEKQKLNNYTILANRAPIYYNEKIIGAVSIIQDISDLEQLHFELRKERELQERLNLVLESVSDLIALTDEHGNYTYLNEQMDELLTTLDLQHSIIGLIKKTKWLEIKRTKQPTVKFLKKKSYIMKIKPLLLDGEFRGAVVSLSPYNELKELLEKLDFMEQRTKYLEQELSKHINLADSFKTIIGNSETLLETLNMANKVSKTDSTILITGESGTGKELVARAIHLSSNRKDGSFIRVNCAAIPPNLIESELFGHEKGAFTGAIKVHQGKFELANHGTIFLDEIGDLPMDMQVKLLRILQEREFERVGGFKTIQLNVRVIAATHQDLNKMVNEGKFREDLYYRLHVIPIHLPSLSARKDDIPLLVDHFRLKFNERLGKNIKGYEAGFLEALGNYHWPGNIRELQNIMERVMTLTEGDRLNQRDLPQYILQQRIPSLEWKESTKVLEFGEYEKQIYQHAAPYFPSYNQLAQALGVTHKTVAAKLKKYEIEHLLGKKYQLSGKYS
jgi:TyrR family helix-turn-helix protein/PAS domain S-box-containing protein